AALLHPQAVRAGCHPAGRSPRPRPVGATGRRPAWRHSSAGLGEPVRLAWIRPSVSYHSLVEHVRILEQPELRGPVLIAAFAGWNDAASCATAAVRLLVEQWQAVK